jgi:ceramide glucosyltransferase
MTTHIGGIIHLALLGLSLFTLSVYAGLTICFSRGRRVKLPLNPQGYPRVSILKPLRGVDDDLERNLESFFDLDYPDFEVLFAVDGVDDPEAGVARAVSLRFPHVPSRIVVTGHDAIHNPKIHKLSALERHARGDLYWISDANLRVEPLTLRRLAAECLEHGAKIVFSPIRATGSGTLGSLIENSYINFFMSGNVIMAWQLLRQQISIGKSILLERRALERFGGFAYFRDHLAEDFIMSESFEICRFRVSSNFTWVTTVNRCTTVRGFYERLARWAVLRFRLKPRVYGLEILINPMVLALPAPALWGGRGAFLLLAVFLLKTAFEYANFLALNEEDRRRPWCHLVFPAAMALQDLVLLAVYLTPFFRRTVSWRGGRIAVGQQTLIAHSQENLLFDGA